MIILRAYMSNLVLENVTYKYCSSGTPARILLADEAAGNLEVAKHTDIMYMMRDGVLIQEGV